jgi:hypothetical protein
VPERKDLWDSPIYRFRLPRGVNPEEPNEFEEVVIDVTGSAPTFKEPSDELKSILQEITTSSDYGGIDTVMEFGAAKLKNIPFILGLGKTVCAVEFEKLTTNDIVKENIRKCQAFGSKFRSVLFPNPFIFDDSEYDLVLLLNVLPVMPLFSERMYLLDLISSRVRIGKYVLWVAQKEGSYKSVKEAGKQACGDGVWMGTGKKLKTFYRYHNPNEIDEMMGLYGLKLVKKFSHGGSDARLYQKTDHNLFRGMLTAKTILKEVPADSAIADPIDTKLKKVKPEDGFSEVLPNPRSLSIESLYMEKLRSILPGTQNEVYHRVVSYALGRIFKDSIRGMEIKQPVHDGIGEIDTVFTNYAKNGFFKSMSERYSSTFPIFEMKNYSEDPGNPEINQVNGRLTANRGNFGILVCRTVKNEERLYDICASKLPDHCILFLTDKDIIEMLNYSRNGGFDDIDEIMNAKLRTLLLKKT